MYSIYETDLKEKNTVNLFDSKDCISGEFVFLYPPGIPLICPGEKMTEEDIAYIRALREAGEKVIGVNEKGEVTVGTVARSAASRRGPAL